MHGRRSARTSTNWSNRMAYDRPGPPRLASTRPIWPGEQVAQRQAQPVGDPSLGKVVWPVVQHVAALAKALEVARVIVRRVMVKMRGRQHDPGRPLCKQIGRAGAGTAPSPAGAPAPRLRIQPTPVGQAGHRLPVRSPARLAAPASPAEPDGPAQLGPVDRVEPAQLRADRHQRAHIRAAMARSSSPTASA